MYMAETVHVVHQVTANTFLYSLYPELRQQNELASEQLQSGCQTDKHHASTSVSGLQGNIQIITYFGHEYDATPLIHLCVKNPAFKVSFTDASACLRLGCLVNDFFATISSGAFRPHMKRIQRIAITCSTQPEITKNFGRLSRTQVAARRRNIKRTGVAPAASEAAPATVEKKVGGAKNNGVRQVAAKKAPKFYGSTPETRSKLARKSNSSAKLRSSITPGTVLILLAGRFRGKRVVFLKQLASGLLLVSGPFKINGVPLRRVNQAYVIATSTKVDISSVSVSAGM
jgi:hypothetical protein